MTQQDNNTVMKFELIVGEDYQSFEIELDPQTFTGTESLLVDQHCGDLQSWINRWVAEQPRGSDIVLLAFLAIRRAQIREHGAATVMWDEFADQVKPYSLRLPTDTTAPKANRSDRRRASRSGSPAKRAAAKDAPVNGPEDDPEFMASLGNKKDPPRSSG